MTVFNIDIEFYGNLFGYFRGNEPYVRIFPIRLHPILSSHKPGNIKSIHHKVCM